MMVMSKKENHGQWSYQLWCYNVTYSGIQEVKWQEVFDRQEDVQITIEDSQLSSNRF